MYEEVSRLIATSESRINDVVTSAYVAILAPPTLKWYAVVMETKERFGPSGIICVLFVKKSRIQTTRLKPRFNCSKSLCVRM